MLYVLEGRDLITQIQILFERSILSHILSLNNQMYIRQALIKFMPCLCWKITQLCKQSQTILMTEVWERTQSRSEIKMEQKWHAIEKFETSAKVIKPCKQ